MSPTYIDSHAHLHGSEFDADRAEVLVRARAAGVRIIVLVAAPRDLSELDQPLRLAETDPDLYATVGVHPHDAARIEPAWWDAMEELASHTKVVGIGETGLDYYYDHSPHPVQREAFARQIELARRVGKPVVCHVRDPDGGGPSAHADTRNLLDRQGIGRPGQPAGVIHCFTGSPEQAAAYASLGLYISFSGIATFKSAAPIRAAVQEVPLDRILIETDCPYLAPVPMRGRRNEPAFLVHTALVLARETGLEPDELAARTSANARALFSLTAA
jgi:TatD DNase family protein